MLRIPQSQNIIDGRPLVRQPRQRKAAPITTHPPDGSFPLLRGEAGPKRALCACRVPQSLRLERAADHSGRWWCAAESSPISFRPKGPLSACVAP